MNTNSDFDRHATAWLADGPTELSDRVLDSALREVHLTRQRGRWAPWRTPNMRFPMRFVAAAVVVAVVGYLGVSYLKGPAGPGGPSPAATSAATVDDSPTVAPSPTIDTSGWGLYVSGRNWLGIEFPKDWTFKYATTDWTPAKTTWESTGVDTFIAPGDDVRISAFSVAVEPGTSLEAWIQTYCEKNTKPCTGILDRSEPIDTTANGVEASHSGILIPFERNTAAFFLDVDRIYVVHSWQPDGEFDSRRILEAAVRSLCFHCASPGAATARPG
ncbi:MAG: hypothetical protein ABI620_06440 [Chloroflexota bacterium]